MKEIIELGSSLFGKRMSYFFFSNGKNKSGIGKGKMKSKRATLVLCFIEETKVYQLDGD